VRIGRSDPKGHTTGIPTKVRGAVARGIKAIFGRNDDKRALKARRKRDRNGAPPGTT
jgi:hypothetical protein